MRKAIKVINKGPEHELFIWHKIENVSSVRFSNFRDYFFDSSHWLFFIEQNELYKYLHQ